MKQQRGNIEVIVGVFVVGIILAMFAIAALVVARSGVIPIHTVVSEGERVGVVYKLSYRGLFCKTYEGSMNLGGMATDGNGQATPNVWHFSVTDPKVVKAINDYAESGRRTTLVYVEYFANGICEGGSNAVVQAVK